MSFYSNKLIVFDKISRHMKISDRLIETETQLNRLPSINHIVLVDDSAKIMAKSRCRDNIVKLLGCTVTELLLTMKSFLQLLLRQ